MPLIRRLTCTQCGNVVEKPHGVCDSMNDELACHKCNSLAFGLIKCEIVEKRARRRVDIKGILRNPAKRRTMTANAVRFVQAVEGRDLTQDEALAVVDRVNGTTFVHRSGWYVHPDTRGQQRRMM